MIGQLPDTDILCQSYKIHHLSSAAFDICVSGLWS